MTLCKSGGSLSFTKLVEQAGLLSPFKDNTVSGVVNQVIHYLSQIDDTQF